MHPDEQMAVAAKFILQSPPGEINDVLNDVRNIISDDELLQEGVQPALRQYNIEQFVVVDIPEHDHQVIISDVGRVEGEQDRFRDPHAKLTFHFDHLRLVSNYHPDKSVESMLNPSVKEASDVQPYEPDEDTEPFRSALEKATLSYIGDHFPGGVSTVHTITASKYAIQIVANKYNPSNFWSGRWRSEYIIDISEGKVQAKIFINVHYFEQGNVQLSTTFKPVFDLPPAAVSSQNASSASKIIALIEARESEHQEAMIQTYFDMSEKTFKGLRRALPITRQKLDWDKVTGYKLGAELAGTRGAFGN